MKDGLIEKFHWNILRKFDSMPNTLSTINILKDIRNDILNGKIKLSISMFLEICPYLFKYNLLNPKSDIFRTIFKAEFVNDKDFIDFILINLDSFRNLLENSNSNDKNDFLNTVRENNDEKEFIKQLADKLIT